MNKSIYFFKAIWKKFYFRPIIKSLREVELQHTNSGLIRISDNLLENFKSFFSSNENEFKSVSEILEFKGNYFKFKFLNKVFLLERDIMIFGGIVVYRTYEIVLSPYNYPDTKLDLLLDFDIVQRPDITRFNKKKTINRPDCGEVDVTTILNFGRQYLTQLAEFIKERELRYLKNIESL